MKVTVQTVRKVVPMLAYILCSTPPFFSPSLFSLPPKRKEKNRKKKKEICQGRNDSEKQGKVMKQKQSYKHERDFFFFLIIKKKSSISLKRSQIEAFPCALGLSIQRKGENTFLISMRGIPYLFRYIEGWSVSSSLLIPLFAKQKENHQSNQSQWKPKETWPQRTIDKYGWLKSVKGSDNAYSSSNINKIQPIKTKRRTLSWLLAEYSNSTKHNKVSKNTHPWNLATWMNLSLPRWYVFVAGKIEDACSASARPALRIGTTYRSKWRS